MHVPYTSPKRQIKLQSLGDIAAIAFPSFVKPMVPKQFRGAVYHSSDELIAECRGLSADTAVFVSEPVALIAEARAFLWEGRVLDCAVYEGEMKTADAERFVADLTQAMTLPRTVVVDVGCIDGRGWAVIEFNAAWGAGLNGCDPDKVLPAIVTASRKSASDLSENPS